MSENDFTAGLKTERLTDIGLAYKKTCTLLTGLDLGLFNAISGGADSLPTIATAIGLDEEKVDRLLTVCKSIELIEEKGGKYRNMSDVERYLVEGKKTYFGRRKLAVWVVPARSVISSPDSALLSGIQIEDEKIR